MIRFTKWALGIIILVIFLGLTLPFIGKMLVGCTKFFDSCPDIIEAQLDAMGNGMINWVFGPGLVFFFAVGLVFVILIAISKGVDKSASVFADIGKGKGGGGASH